MPAESQARLRLIVHGTMHAATTTFSRYVADVDHACLYWFEPDRGMLTRAAGAVTMTSHARVTSYASVLQCDPGRSNWSDSWSGFSAARRG